MRFSKMSPSGRSDLVGVKVRRHRTRDYEVENIRLAHLLDFVLELEVLEDPADVAGEALGCS
jgi:hypothetical protein